MPRPIIIDTDPRIDDPLPIMLAAASPEVKILGIVAVAGNVGLEHTAANAASLADLLRLTCPVGRGASGPLWRRDTSSATEVHGTNGRGGYQLPTSKRPLEAGIPLCARLIETSPEPVTVVAIGPLTNIALLINQHPETARKVERFVIMGGGTLDVLGNTTPAAEFNIYYDPDAAACLFNFGVPITMVGLNATHHTLLRSSHLPHLLPPLPPVLTSAPPPRLLAPGGRVAKMVAHLIASYHKTPQPSDESAQHDSLALAAVVDPSILTTSH